MRTKNRKIRKILALVATLAVLIGVGGAGFSGDGQINFSQLPIVSAIMANSTEQNVSATLANTTEYFEIPSDDDVVYLSDQTPIYSKVGWGTLSMDKDLNGNKISLRVDGSNATFNKGIFAHAYSNLIFDLSAFKEQGFTHLSGYFGVNTSATSEGNLRFRLYTSNDNKTWTEANVGLPTASTRNTNATYVKLDIRNVRYVRLEANTNGHNGNDHAAYGDLKLVREDYSELVTTTAAQYTEQIMAQYAASGEMTPEIQNLIFKRELANGLGGYQTKTLFQMGTEYEETYKWLMDNPDVLEMFMMGGAPDGNYRQALVVLTQLRMAFGDDLNATGTSSVHKVPLSKVYTKMMLSLSITHSTTVKFWVYGSGGTENKNTSNAVWRYEIFRDLFQAGKLRDYFDTLEVEEMRYIMNSTINDDEIKWAREYWEKDKKKSLWPYDYMPYQNVGSPYQQDKFYADTGADISSYVNKYKLNTYGTDDAYGELDVTVGNYAKYPRLWMIMEAHGVCWQGSNLSASIAAATGTPTIMVGQPRHSAFLMYSQTNTGTSMWSLGNPVDGWEATNTLAYSGTKAYYEVRLPLTWGNGSYRRNNASASYVTLSAAAIDDYDNLVKAEALVKLAKLTSSADERVKLYEQAIAVQRLNFDAWLGLINEWNADDSKTNLERVQFADRVATNFRLYPLPMYDLLQQISKKVTDPSYAATLTRIQTDNLNYAAYTATGAQIAQIDVTRTMAKYLLGQYDTKVVSFSFDGDNAGKIMLASRLSGATFDYKLAEDDEWTAASRSEIQLTDEEIARITSSYGIKVHIIGMSYDAVNIHQIAIQAGKALESTLEVNDKENTILRTQGEMEWQLEGTDTWTRYSQAKPDLRGDKKVTLRYAAVGTRMVGPEKTFSFTSNGEDDPKHVYIPISELSLYSYSAQDGSYPAKNVLDGSVNTQWITPRNTTSNKVIVIKLAEPRRVSALEYVPGTITVSMFGTGVAGLMKTGEVAYSMDGKNFTTYQKMCDNLSNCTANNARNIIQHANNTNAGMYYMLEPVMTQYIRIIYKDNYDSANFGGPFMSNMHASAKMFNLFYDASEDPLPNMRVEYSYTGTTNQDVVATLINPTPSMKVIYDEGESHTFTENGEFTFHYRNERGDTGELTATVNWIDKEKPTLATDVAYENVTLELDGGSEIDAKKVTAKLSEGVEVINEGVEKIYNDDKSFRGFKLANGQEIEVSDNNKTLVAYFKANAELSLQVKDVAGNENTIMLAVTDLEEVDDEASRDIPLPDFSLKFSTLLPTNEDVLVELINPTPDVEVHFDSETSHIFTENGEYVFRYHNDQGESDTRTAIVDWIDKESPTLLEEVIYEDLKLTGEDGEEVKAKKATAKFNEVVIVANDGAEVVKDEAGALIGYRWNNNVFELADGGKTLSYVFTENHEFDLIVKDAVGNVGTVIMAVSDLNAEEEEEEQQVPLPEFELKYSHETLTNHDVVAELICKGEEDACATVQYDTPTSHIFTENDIFVFKASNKWGESREIEAKVDWIDKDKPKLKLGNVLYKLIHEVVDGVMVEVLEGTAEFDEPVEVINDGVEKRLDDNKEVIAYVLKDGKMIDVADNGRKLIHYFWANYELELVVRDAAGNEETVTMRAEGLNLSDDEEDDNGDDNGGDNNDNGNDDGGDSNDDTGDNTGGDNGNNDDNTGGDTNGDTNANGNATGSNTGDSQNNNATQGTQDWSGGFIANNQTESGDDETVDVDDEQETVADDGDNSESSKEAKTQTEDVENIKGENQPSKKAVSDEQLRVIVPAIAVAAISAIVMIKILSWLIKTRPAKVAKNN